jgi:hypothetical protein
MLKNLKKFMVIKMSKAMNIFLSLKPAFKIRTALNNEERKHVSQNLGFI